MAKQGRPRNGDNVKPTGKAGYAQKTVGKKGSGKRVYVHRSKVGLGASSKGGKTVVDHKDGNTRNNARGNLRVTTRGKNANRGK